MTKSRAATARRRKESRRDTQESDYPAIKQNCGLSEYGTLPSRFQVKRENGIRIKVCPLGWARGAEPYEGELRWWIHGQ